jgi:hypothetical protein
MFGTGQPMVIWPEESKAAHKLLRWSQQHVAARLQVSALTVAGGGNPTARGFSSAGFTRRRAILRVWLAGRPGKRDYSRQFASLEYPGFEEIHMSVSSSVYTTPAFWERLWRLSGVNFVVFFIIAYVIYGISRRSARRPTHSSRSTTAIARAS